MDPSSEQHGEWTSDLAGAEDLLDQPDGDEPMEHSGLKTEVKRPPAQPADAGNATGAVKIIDSPNVINHVPSPTLDPSRTNFVGGNGAVKTAVQYPPARHDNSSSSEDGRTYSVGGKYLAIQNHRLEKMAFQDLSGGKTIACKNYGTFRNVNDSWFRLTSESHDIVSMTNTISTVNPLNFACNVCPVSHPVLVKKGSGRKPKEDDCCVLVLSDQNFPLAVPSDSPASNCLSVIRIEFASVSELTDKFLELSKSAYLPEGSIVLLGSACHLARVGTVTYCRDLVQSIVRIRGVMGVGSFVSPCPFIMGGGGD